MCIVDYDNNILPVLVERCIERKKPFSENKDEFQDAIIWLSYANLVNNQQLMNCYFITNNTSDFYSENKTQLHQYLIDDCADIILVKSAKKILESDQEVIRTTIEIVVVQEKLVEWLSTNPMTPDYVQQIINNRCFDYVGEFLGDFLKEGNTPNNNNSYWEPGDDKYITNEGVNIGMGQLDSFVSRFNNSKIKNPIN